MSDTYGWLKGAKGESTRCGHKEIWAKLQTWNGHVEVTVRNDETCSITVNNLDVRLNGTRMYAEHKVAAPPTTTEMIRSLRSNMKKLFEDERDGSPKDKTWLHSLLPYKRVRELGPLIRLLQQYQKELGFKMDTHDVIKEVKE